MEFRGSITPPARPLSTLRYALTERQRMTRDHRDSLRLRCRAFSSPSPCRFIPALSPTIHPNLPTLATLTVTDQHRATRRIKISLGEIQCLTDRKPARHRITISARSRAPSAPPRHTRQIASSPPTGARDRTGRSSTYDRTRAPNTGLAPHRAERAKCLRTPRGGRARTAQRGCWSRAAPYQPQ